MEIIMVIQYKYENKTIIKKPKHKELANYLGVSEHTVKKYPKKKRDLMILGLWKKKEILNKT